MYEALRKELYDSENDYVLNEESRTVWITVDNISVYIKRMPDGVQVELFPRGDEDTNAITGCYAPFDWEEI